ncbi:MAG: DUF4411 family protein [Planctomycetes bacterium]|nr:DUF4411 family protein [Planctomycetota bacterium]
MADDFKYSIDTSALVHAYQRSYPPDILPDLWETKFDELIEAGQLFAAFDVLEELERKHDDLFAWAKERPAMFVEIDQFPFFGAKADRSMVVLS